MGVIFSHTHPISIQLASHHVCTGAPVLVYDGPKMSPAKNESSTGPSELMADFTLATMPELECSLVRPQKSRCDAPLTVSHATMTSGVLHRSSRPDAPRNHYQWYIASCRCGLQIQCAHALIKNPSSLSADGACHTLVMYRTPTVR